MGFRPPLNSRREKRMPKPVTRIEIFSGKKEFARLHGGHVDADFCKVNNIFRPQKGSALTRRPIQLSAEPSSLQHKVKN